MKQFIKMLFLFGIIIFILVGCGNSEARLTVVNDFTAALQDCQWCGTILGLIDPGTSVSVRVGPGSDYLYFTCLGRQYRTVDTITVNKGMTTTYTVTGATPVVPLSSARDNVLEIPLKDYFK